MVRARVGIPVGIAIATVCAFGPGQIAALTDRDPRPAGTPTTTTRGAGDDVRVRSPAAVLARRAELRAARARKRARRAAADAARARAAPKAAATAPVPAVRAPIPATPPERGPVPTVPERPPVTRDPAPTSPPRTTTAPADDPIAFDDSG